MIKKNYFIGIWLLFLPMLLSAQSVFQLEDMRPGDSTNILIGIRSEGFVNSNALSGRASNAGFFGGYITPEQRQFMLDRAGTENTVGEFLNNSVFFAKRIDSLFGKQKAGLSFFVNITDRQEANSVFSKNALNLVMFGNKQFAGKTISLAPLGVNQYRYNQFQLGINKTYTNDVRLGIGLSFLYGQNNQSGYAETLDLYTSESGDEISGNADLELNQTDPINAKPFAFNGAGASMDVSIDFPMSLSHRILKDARFKVSVYDLGFINWHSSSHKSELKGPFEFDGVTVDNIFDNQSNEEDLGEYLDSLINKDTVSYTSFIPASLNLELKQEFESSQISLGFLYRHNAFFKPFLYAKYGHDLGTNFNLSAQLNFGGYGKFGGGLELKYTGSHIDLKLGSTNIEGFLNPDKWAGQSIYILLAYKL